MEDGQIVDLFLSRNEAAIQCSSEKYGLRLRALALHIVGETQTAEECENDAYLAAWNAIPPHEPRDYLYAFLARTVRNIALNRCRSQSRLKRDAFVAELSREMEECIPAPDGLSPGKALHSILDHFPVNGGFLNLHLREFFSQIPDHHGTHHILRWEVPGVDHRQAQDSGI